MSGILLIRKLIVVSVLFLALVAIVYFFGSRDSENFDDRGLGGVLIDVPANQNGFGPIAYMLEDEFELDFDSSYQEQLQEHIYHKTWDQNFAENLAFENTKHIESFVASARYEQFKFPAPDPEDLMNLPLYTNVLDGSRLVILQAMLEARAGRYDESMKLTQSASDFAQNLKSESSHPLVSHAIGWVLQHELLLWVQFLASEFALEELHFQDLLRLIETIPVYKNDSFSKVFSGEFNFSRASLELMVDPPLDKRLDKYWKDRKMLSSWEDSGDFLTTPPQDAVNFLSTIFPKYYIHKNSVLNKLGIVHSSLAAKSANYCNLVGPEPGQNSFELDWADIVRPNSMGLKWTLSTSVFDSYFERRCLNHFYLSAVQTIVAIKAYERKFGNTPDTLDRLIPAYLKEIPIDPFGGDRVKYSVSKDWIYSLGSNLEDNGGNESGNYTRHCDRDDQCSSNPTIPIRSKTLQKEAVTGEE